MWPHMKSARASPLALCSPSRRAGHRLLRGNAARGTVAARGTLMAGALGFIAADLQGRRLVPGSCVQAQGILGAARTTAFDLAQSASARESLRSHSSSANTDGELAMLQ